MQNPKGANLCLIMCLKGTNIDAYNLYDHGKVLAKYSIYLYTQKRIHKYKCICIYVCIYVFIQYVNIYVCMDLDDRACAFSRTQFGVQVSGKASAQYSGLMNFI